MPQCNKKLLLKSFLLLNNLPNLCELYIRTSNMYKIKAKVKIYNNLKYVKYSHVMPCKLLYVI